MNKSSRGGLLAVLVLAAALICGLALALHQQGGSRVLTAEDLPAPDGAGLELYFFDVGQADSILVRCGGRSLLVDGGNRDDGPWLVQELSELGVTALDYIACTHPHEDHAGGLAYVANRVPAAQALVSVPQSDNVWFNDFLAVMGEGRWRPAQAGEEFSLGDAQVQVLGPLRDYEDVNDSSLVLRIVYGTTAVLLTGDATREAERDLVASGCELDADLLKLGHHGSNSSTGYLFLRQVAPTWAVASVGADNEYGHPGADTLSRLSDAEVTLLRTDELGTIACFSDGKSLSFSYTGRP